MCGFTCIAAVALASSFAYPPVRLFACDGRDDAPILLSIPGNGGWNYLSVSLAKRLGLTRHYRVAVYDMRGIGDTDEPPPSTWSVHIQDAIHLARGLVRDNGVSQITLLGYSTGTYVALETAHAAPELFDRVVLMGLIPNNDADVDAVRKQNMWNALWMPGWMVDLASSFKSDPLTVQLATMTELSTNGGMIDLLRNREDVTPSDTRTQNQLSSAMSAIEMPDIRLEHIVLRCPLYVIQGSKDTMGVASVIPSTVDRIRAPRKRVFWIEGAGHLLHVTHTAQVRERLDEVFAEARARNQTL
jgi:pimeloyl-ACP methyl ester carboxylesterase